MNIDHLRRAVKDATSRSGMTVGLPKVTVDASQLNHLLDHYEQLQSEHRELCKSLRKTANLLEDIQIEALDTVANYEENSYVSR